MRFFFLGPPCYPINAGWENQKGFQKSPIRILEGSDMNSERPTAATESQSPTTSQPDGTRSACYLVPSPMTEVMFDQLEYLLAHAAQSANPGQSCVPECMDCGRLQQVRNWLLMPFHSAMHPRVQ
jgi:hypothetical protein